MRWCKHSVGRRSYSALWALLATLMLVLHAAPMSAMDLPLVSELIERPSLSQASENCAKIPAAERCDDNVAPYYYDESKAPHVFSFPVLDKAKKKSMKRHKEFAGNRVPMTGFPKSGTTYVHLTVHEIISASLNTHVHYSPATFHMLLYCIQSASFVRRLYFHDSQHDFPLRNVSIALQKCPRFGHLTLFHKRVFGRSLSLKQFAADMDVLHHTSVNSDMWRKYFQKLKGPIVVVVRELFSTLHSHLVYFKKSASFLPGYFAKQVKYMYLLTTLLSRPELREKVTILRYEDVVQDPGAEFARVFRIYAEQDPWFSRINSTHIREGLRWTTRERMSALERLIPHSPDCSKSQTLVKVSDHSADSYTRLRILGWKVFCDEFRAAAELLPEYVALLETHLGYRYEMSVFEHCEAHTQPPSDFVTILPTRSMEPGS